MSKATENPENVQEEDKKTLTIAEKIQKELDAEKAKLKMLKSLL